MTRSIGYVLTQLNLVVAERSAGLSKTLDAAALAPYLGTYANDALGTNQGGAC